MLHLTRRIKHYIRNPQQIGSAAGFILWAAEQRARRQTRTCPHCGSASTVALGTRSIVLTLMECRDCLLKFRYPKQSGDWGERYYQRTDTSGLELPDGELLQKLQATGFSSTDFCVRRITELMKKLGPGKAVLDFGCSWGYAVWQFKSAGYDAAGFELSKLKAAFGSRELGVDIIADYGELEKLPTNRFDFIFTSHVLEHLPELHAVLSLFSRLLCPGGRLIVLVPNGAGASAHESRGVWYYSISREHNLALDAAWFHRNVPAYGFDPVFASSTFGGQFSDLMPFDTSTPPFMTLPGEELLMVATRQ